MAKKASPWFWEARGGWYVTLHGKQHRLGEHPEGVPTPEKSQKTGRWNSPQQIDAAFRRLLDGGQAVEPAGGDTVVEILDDFITWCKEHRAPFTAERYEEFCQDFVTFHPEGGLKLGALSVRNVSSKHVTLWLAARTSWGPTTKRNAITALQRGFNWACKNRGLDRNPIRGMEKPEAKTRTGIVTSDEFETLLKAIPDQRFQDLLIVSYDSGGRPFEVKELEARHCQLDKHRAVIPKDEAKGRKHPRTIYFPTERSLLIIRRLCEKFPEGPLFRNRLARKWTALAVKCRMEDLDHVLGRRVRHYDLRHSFVTRKIVSGVDSHVVAKLAGHRDTKMIDQVYSHVADDYEFMLQQASKDIDQKKNP
jgi:integrase